MVKEITEMALLTVQTLPNPQSLLGFLSRNNRDVLRLFEVFLVSSFRTEAEAIEKAGIGERTKFRQVAKELLRCLEQMTFLIGFEKQTLDDLNHHRVRGFQRSAAMRTLGLLGCKNASKKAAEELLKLGLTYARPEYVVEATKTLMDYVSVAGEDPKEFDDYLCAYEEFSCWRALEEKAHIYYDKVKIPYAKRKGMQQDLAALAKGFADELQPYVGKAKAHGFHVCYYHLRAYQHTILADYAQASALHEEAIEYFLSRPYPCNGTLNIFYALEIANCFYLGQYERSGHFFQQALETAAVGSVNWFNTLELGFYLRMHEQNWMSAAEIYIAATRHKRFSLLRDARREAWRILGAYLYIASQLTGAVLPEGNLPKFKSSRFRNDIKDFAQDKTGLNIAVLAAEVLLDLVDGKDDELWNRIAALEKYRERYLLHQPGTHRSQIFVKVLTIFSKYNYDGKKFADKAAPYLAELRATPLKKTSQAYEIEIIPYEQLIAIIAQYAAKRWGRVSAGRVARILADGSADSRTPMAV